MFSRTADADRGFSRILVFGIQNTSTLKNSPIKKIIKRILKKF
jgi:hypothetical protein